MRLTTKTAAMIGMIGALLLLPTYSDAGCGCNKPPPPVAGIRPFVAHADQTITLFGSNIREGKKYDVQFVNTVDWSMDWSRGKAAKKKDLADRQLKPQLRVKVPNIGFGPVRVYVWDGNNLVASYTDDKLTVTAQPVALHDVEEALNKPNYRAGVDRQGTIYVTVDVSQVSDATRFTGAAVGLPVNFQSSDVAMYNEQGFLMQLLDPTNPGLFEMYAGDNDESNILSYWRHEFRTYKEQHRDADNFATDDDPEWHEDGTPHIDHDRIVVAIRGRYADGTKLAAGKSPAFRLIVMSEPEEH
jgi:hypothetical protein